MPSPRRLRFPAALVTLALWGCSTASHSHEAPAPAEGRLIGAAQIERSGAVNAWEVIRRTAPSMEARDTPGGHAASLNQRGRGSLLLDETPVITVDGIRITDFQELEVIPAQQIFSVRILNSSAATKYFGTGASGGAVLISLKKSVDGGVRDTVAVQPVQSP
jgi:outer membrane cobalamin receptor